MNTLCCCERTRTATLKVNGKQAFDTKTKLKLMDLAQIGLADLPEQAEMLMHALCLTGGMQGTSNIERYEMRVMTAYLDKMAKDRPEYHKVADRMSETLVEGVAEEIGVIDWRDERPPWWMPNIATLERQRQALNEQKRAAAEAAAEEPPFITAERLDSALKSKGRA